MKNVYTDTLTKKRTRFVLTAVILMMAGLTAFLGYLMVYKAGHYINLANELHEREREIKAARGEILDRNGVAMASNETVCTVSVIHRQIEDADKVVQVLAKELEADEADIRKKVEKVSALERIKTNVSKETGDKIRSYKLAGVKVDEDYKRFYPYNSLASKVLGFTGSDNQGIIGLEVKYDSVLQGENGKILTTTDAAGNEIEGVSSSRIEPVAGNSLVTTLDVNIQTYATQLAYKTLEEKGANYVSIIVMNPKNGEIYGMVNAPEYNLNTPYTVDGEKKSADELNQLWRNSSINDTYEPGSTFKMITATIGLEKQVVDVEEMFSCPGYKIVEDRRIKCHKLAGHGMQTFTEATMNSCNPVFIEVGQRIGVESLYEYMEKFGFMEKTGIDLPGEATSILHNIDNVGLVELATMSFGQSFQITPLQLLRAASAIINGGTLVTPHLAIKSLDEDGNTVEEFEYKTVENVISKQTCEKMKIILDRVVSDETNKLGNVEGYAIGGKTATSEKLPRGSGKYIASYIGFSPVEDPEVIAMCIIDEPKGVYYGGMVAAPVISELYTNILPYLGIESN